MIKTKYFVNLAINESEFELEVREPNLTEKKELELRAANSGEKIKSLENLAKKENALNIRIAEINELISVNKELLRQLSISDKITLLNENKALIKERGEKQKELSELEDNKNLISEIENDLESVFEFKTQTLISAGTEFYKTLRQNNISFRTLWEHLDVLISKEREKK